MRYALTDYTTTEKDNVTFGTCELCMSTGTMTEQYFHFKDETGRVHIVEGFMWDWGDLFEIYIENIPHFAEWVAHQDIDPPSDENYGHDYAWLSDLVHQYDSDTYAANSRTWAENNATLSGATVQIEFDEPRDVDYLEIEEVLSHVDPDNTLGIGGNCTFIVPEGHTFIEDGLEPGEEVALSFDVSHRGEINLDIIVLGESWENYKSVTIELGECPCTVTIDFSLPRMLPKITVD